MLQALFEYQSMICELTGIEVSNASLYDGATALVEAVHMTLGPAPRAGCWSPTGVDPRPVEALRTAGRGAGYEPEVFARGDGARRSSATTSRPWSCSTPTLRGARAGARALRRRARRAGARRSRSSTRSRSGVLAPPGELGADIAVGEGQALGNHLNYGGPYLGIIAARHGGRAQDARAHRRARRSTSTARTGYVLTLQAREQHIRREKANSNICTNQTLMAIAATVYLGWLGPEGLAELGRQCASKAAYAAERLTELPGVSLAFPGAPFFKEFAVRLPRPADRGASTRWSTAGSWRASPMPQAGDDVLVVAVTERRSRAEIDGFVAAMGEVLAA